MGKQEERGTGLKDLIFWWHMPHPAYLSGSVVSKATPVLINASKYASPRRAEDTRVAI